MRRSYRTDRAWHEVMRGDRPQASVMHVVLARPNHLDWALGFLGEQDRINNELLVAVAAPAEAAAEQGVMQRDLPSRARCRAPRRERPWSASAASGDAVEVWIDRCASKTKMKNLLNIPTIAG
jgi:hypothetical protein